MNRLIKALVELVEGLSRAVFRFPLTVLCLICASALVCYTISLHKDPELIIFKLMFTALLGAFIGVACQFACERFKRLAGMRIGVYAFAALLILGYFMIVRPAPAIDFGVGARTSVAIFAMFCAFIWLPSYGEKFDFNSVALVHFKSFFTAVLYAGVLSAGLSSIIAAINFLLFRINSDWYGYTNAVVWILFATIYYLSLLPNFNSDAEEDRAYAREASHYPRFLDILVSYIAIPLVAAYTMVLLVYFVKIGVTRTWPVGQIGPMVLWYSSVGAIIYILASRLQNRFAVLYQQIFPKVLIPIVVMQLISVYIRINAYGFTEGRYYVALFGLFSVLCGVVFSFKPVTKNGLYAVAAAIIAIISVIPPVDAFTVSRHSQVNRLNSMLQAEGVLVNGVIAPKADADLTLRLETTSILNYLERRKYTEDLTWLPADFDTNRDMQKVLGYEPAYEYMGSPDQNFFANLNMEEPLNIEGYDVLLQVSSKQGSDPKAGDRSSYDFNVRGEKYQLILEWLSPLDNKVAILDSSGKELVATGLYDFATSIPAISDRPKEMLDVKDMTLDAAGNGCQMRIIFQNINISYGRGEQEGAFYNMFVLVAVPK